MPERDKLARPRPKKKTLTGWILKPGPRRGVGWGGGVTPAHPAQHACTYHPATTTARRAVLRQEMTKRELDCHRLLTSRQSGIRRVCM